MTRKAGRPAKQYNKPAPPKWVTIPCPKCRKPHRVALADVLYAELPVAVATCTKCGTKIA